MTRWEARLTSIPPSFAAFLNNENAVKYSVQLNILSEYSN